MRKLSLAFLLFLVLLLPVGSISAQERPVATVELVDVDAAAFPLVTLSLTAQDATGQGFDSLTNVQLFENDVAIDDVALSNVPTGVDVTFIIDNNATIAGIDLIGDVSRFEKVKLALGQFAQQYLNRSGLDSMTIMAGNGEQIQYVVSDASDVDAVEAALAAFTPETFERAVPLQEMLLTTFEEAAASAEQSRYQAVVLLSDATNLRDQLDFFALRDAATQSNVVFFGAILGKVASADEVAIMEELFIPTGGGWAHMPKSEDIEPLFRTIRSNGSQHALTFRSRVAESGAQLIRIELDEQVLQATYRVAVAPPGLELLLDNRPIERIGDIDTPIDQMQPQSVSIATQLSWPDEHPRQLESVRFFVNDIEQRLAQPPVLDAAGLLTFDWNIRGLDTGTYELAIEVVDELGLVARSESLLRQIKIDNNAPEPTATPAPVPTPTSSPIEQTFDQVQPWLSSETMTQLLLGVIGLLVAVLLFRLLRRNRKTTAPRYAPLPAVPPPPANVYLQVLSAEKDSSLLMPLRGDRFIIGSDPFRADVILDDPRVSRHHARLVFENEQYVLYDEDSAYGTSVNYQRLGLRPVIVRDGDELSFGGVITRLRIFGEEATEDEIRANLTRQKRRDALKASRRAQSVEQDQDNPSAASADAPATKQDDDTQKFKKTDTPQDAPSDE